MIITREQLIEHQPSQLPAGADPKEAVERFLGHLRTSDFLTAQQLAAAINHRWGIGCQARGCIVSGWTGMEEEHVLQLFAPETEQVCRARPASLNSLPIDLNASTSWSQEKADEDAAVFEAWRGGEPCP